VAKRGGALPEEGGEPGASEALTRDA
jgi:hypothetical protein